LKLPLSTIIFTTSIVGISLVIQKKSLLQK